MSGYIIYEGPSSIDRKPIVVIAIEGSTNGKTGNLLQTYIMRSDIPPTLASKTGEDYSICGDCKHRGIPTADPEAKQAKERACYVVLGQGPTVVFKAYKRGLYRRAKPADVGADKDVRIGTYGDGAAAPIETWEELLLFATGWTGYTHQWRTRPELRDFCMASVDTFNEKQQANANGWRTFRIAYEGESLGSREVPCPSERGVQCKDCLLCSGAVTQAKNIAIVGHGAGRKYL